MFLARNKMGRPRTPTAILDAKGAFLRNPERKQERAGEPTPVGELGLAPRRLSKALRALWREISAQLLPGVACAADRSAFEMLVQLENERRTNPLMKAADKRLLLTLYGKFGMSPSDRSKVSGAQKEPSQLSAFLSKRKEKATDEPLIN